ncbi:MAG: hypothetical protein CMJ64_00135 [Planctomycetaceae bacterium]|nr:hypothetical protein [Planctomycetaceae bacterium]
MQQFRHCLLTIAIFCQSGALAARAADADVEFFEKKIRPVLVERCYKCHSTQAESVKGGLLLDSRDTSRKGGESGAAVVPGNVDESLALSALRYDSFEMPPDGKLPAAVIADFEKWITMGAPDPRDAAPSKTAPDEIDWAKARQFWAFQPPTRHKTPSLTEPSSVHRATDAFVLAKLERAGIASNPEANRRTLIRRVTFDLIGLPPTPGEIANFVNDDVPQAYERLVDRLLASPHYGERWARMWLDISRYAEDQAHIVGNNTSLCYPNAYAYRDWVINALNADVPYDNFVRQQLAADLIDPQNKAGHIALGFVGLGPKYYRRSDPEVMAEEWEDRVDTVTRGLLGITVACARCHDHKYDPIETEDYYALAGVFASTEMFNRPLDAKREKDKDGQSKKAEDAVHIVRDKNPHDLHVHIRGNVKKPGPLTQRRFLRVVSATEPQPFTNGSGRLELANAIVSRDNPLTARVIVNRVWALHFGRPLVGTPSNFGSLGERPTHPQLLDDLAVRFMESGWSLKWLQREIVSSATYRQTSAIVSKKQAIDPSNQLLWRMNRRRLGVEPWRDALLAAAGGLERQVGGKSIKPQDPNERRRTMYSYISRLELDSMLAMFDFPDPNAHSPSRVETTTPLQKLFVLNSPFMVKQAEALAVNLIASAGGNEERIRNAYESLYGRLPQADEVELGLDFLSGCVENDDHGRWTQYAQVLLASNEMLMMD